MYFHLIHPYSFTSYLHHSIFLSPSHQIHSIHTSTASAQLIPPTTYTLRHPHPLPCTQINAALPSTSKRFRPPHPMLAPHVWGRGGGTRGSCNVSDEPLMGEIRPDL